MKKILVLDSSEDVRMLVEDALAGAECQVAGAGTGEDGLTLAAQFLPDLILCDLQLRGLNGFGVLEAIRREGLLRTVPFIMLTGFADRGQMRRAMELGADDYLIKPFSIAELLAAVQARMEKGEAFSRAAAMKLTELRESIQMALPHEMRTPLNAIIGYSQLLAEAPNHLSAEDVKECASYIYAAGRRLARLTDTFLTYAWAEGVRLDAGRLESLRREPGCISAEVLLPAARAIARQYGRADDLRENASAHMIPVPGEQLQKLVAELVDNAFKFSDMGTPVELSSWEDDLAAYIRVKDEGRGLTDEEKASIGAHMQFGRRFHEQQGAGLGLIVSQRITELFRGEFRIESESGKGTEVTVVFRRAPSSGPSGQEGIKLQGREDARKE